MTQDTTLMETKVLEVRDRSTLIPMLCVLMVSGNEREARLLWRVGYTQTMRADYAVMMTPANGGDRADSDPFSWGDGRTLRVAHEFITKNWSAIRHGQVIDVEFILGETTTEKESEYGPLPEGA